MAKINDFRYEIDRLASVENPSPIEENLLRGYITLNAANIRLGMIEAESPGATDDLLDRVGHLASAITVKAQSEIRQS